jgi:GntR family transcriptional regulator
MTDRPAPRRLRYQDVMAMIERLIADEQLGPGDLLPSRAELAATAGVSLITVRRALNELQQDGRVHSHQGVGTFVARPRIVSAPGRAGGLLGTLAEEHGAHEILTRVLDVTRGRPSQTVAHALQLEPGAEVWRIRRLRVIDGRPMIVEQAVIPVALAPDLNARTAEAADSLYRLLARRYGLEDDYEEQFLEVVAPSPDERRLLELDKGAQVVRLRGVSFEPHGRSFDCFQQVYPASEVVFSISGQTARHVFRGTDLRDWSVTPVAGSAAARDRAAHPPPAPPIAPVETPGTRVARQPQVSERGGNV